MNIILKDQSNYLLGKDKGRHHTTGIKIKKSLNTIFDQYIQTLNISNIHSVIVDNIQDAFGKANPIAVNGIPMVDIIVSSTIARKIRVDAFNNDDVHIIVHELCHAKDYENSTQRILYSRLPDTTKQPKTPYELYYFYGYRMLGEYIAYKMSNNIIIASDAIIERTIVTAMRYLDDCIIYLELIRSYCKSGEFALDVFLHCKNKIDEFIYVLFKNLGYLHSIGDPTAIDKFISLFGNDDRMGQYVLNANHILIDFSSHYPNNLTEVLFSHVGCSICDIYKLFGLYINENNPQSVIEITV